LIDKEIFNKDIVLKTAFSFLDKGFFFFKKDEKGNLILQFTAKDGVKEKPENIIGNFSDSLLETLLRDKLEKDNKVIREAIVLKAINGPLDQENFVSLDTDQIQSQQENQEGNQIDFDKDIDDILKEIENDPELKIDEEEIENILKEIEEEAGNDANKPKITLDPEGLKKAKKDFNK
jgi:His-Xaa-Ser system protein HxsD